MAAVGVAYKTKYNERTNFINDWLIRLGLGVYIRYTGFETQSILSGLLAASCFIRSLQILVVVQRMVAPYLQNNSDNTEDVEYEEITSK
jgi:hypothetical protein